jgi:excisionase family DNA binding protein
MNHYEQPPLGLTIFEAAQIAGIGRSTLYQALSTGQLRARKLGRRTIILHQDLRVWLDDLPAYSAGEIMGKPGCRR